MLCPTCTWWEAWEEGHEYLKWGPLRERTEQRVLQEASSCQAGNGRGRERTVDGGSRVDTSAGPGRDGQVHS